MKGFLKKIIKTGEEKKFALLVGIAVAVGFVFHFTIMNLITESIHFFIIGYILGEMYYEVLERRYRKRVVASVFIVIFIILLSAIVLDPLLKPWLDMVFNANTVSNFHSSVWGNCFVFTFLWLGYLVRYLTRNLADFYKP